MSPAARKTRKTGGAGAAPASPPGRRPDARAAATVRRLEDELAGAATELAALRSDYASRRTALDARCAEMEVARDRFEALYDLSPTGFLTVARDSVILEANTAAIELLGARRLGLRQRTLAEFVVRAHRKDLRAYLEQCFAGDAVSFAELWLQRADGTRFHALLQSRLTPGDVERKSCRISLWDNTERWEAIEALRASEARYHALANELARAREESDRRAAEAESGRKRLEHSNRELERSNRDLEQFAGIVAHDLREPLRAIVGFSELLRERIGAQLDATSAGYLQHVGQAAASMQRLLDDLLLFCRADRPRNRLGVTDLNLALGKALLNLRALVEETAAAVSQERLPTVAADETQMVQLLQNLVSNAIKFRREGPPRIHLTAETRRDEEIIGIRDEGIGIPPGQSERIFQIFTRLHGRGGPEGTGIGLAICRRILERHGGRIWVESRPGKGSTFFFALPRPADSGLGPGFCEQTPPPPPPPPP
ncbi:MAG TPA: ATP-binding protein, partial [bacterium]